MRVERLRTRNFAGRIERLLGRVALPMAANPPPRGLHLNTYSNGDEVIGLWLAPGGRRYLSWVWPVAIKRKPVQLPWPDVLPCHGWNPQSHTAMQVHPDPLCAQCDGHEHEWVRGPRRVPVNRTRCRICGTPRR